MEGVGKEEEKGQVGKEAAMESLEIWHAVSGWTVQAKFDNEQEANKAYDMLADQASPISKSPEAEASQIKTAHRQVSVDEVGSVYSGLPGCTCGCRGKYWYAPGEPHEDWQGKENPKQVQRIVNIINAAPELDFDDPDFVSTTIEGRVYTAYMKSKIEAPKVEVPVTPELQKETPMTPAMRYEKKFVRETSLKPKVEKKACRVGEKVYYRGHPATIKEIFINKYSGEPHVDVEVEGEVLSLSGKEIDQLGDEPLMEEMQHKDVKVEEPKIEMPIEEPKVELPIEPKEVIEEIESKASKKDVLLKLAEIESPWTVEKQADGTSIIVRREIKKENKEEEKDLTK